MSDAKPSRDAGATDAWLGDLRARFLAVARRRVPPSAAEDVVQETLRILVEKGVREAGSLAPGGTPALAYGFRVLRNVIGNHYQRERVRERSRAPAEEAAGAADREPTPLEALASGEAVRIVREALQAMDATDAPCARYLGRLLEGRTPRDLALEEGLEEAILYRRVYRCRRKLRVLLERRGLFA
jgi:RNA polymerase sigma factor (sigma-70 family)